MKTRLLARVGRLALALLFAAQGASLPADAVLSGGAGAGRQAADGFDGFEVGALLSEVARNERAMLGRRLEYTWTAKVTDRERNGRGEVTRESVSVYEVYPVRGEFARKLISEDGVPVSRERAERELKKTAERLEKAAQEERKRAEQRTPPAGQNAPPAEAAAQPAEEVQKPYARLAGRLWVDAEDRAVVRLEAWPSDARPPTGAGPSVVFEHERLPDGVWLERLVSIKTYDRRDIFNGIALDHTKEATAFQRFSAAADEKP